MIESPKIWFPLSLVHNNGKIDVDSRMLVLDVALGNQMLAGYAFHLRGPSFLGKNLLVKLVGKIPVFIEIH